jgi:hypothetical protein
LSKLTANIALFLVCLTAAARAESAPPPKERGNALADKLKSPVFSEVETAVGELVSIHDPEAAALLGSLYGNGDAQRRLLAIRALGRLGSPAVAEPLFRVALGDLFQAIRLAAVDALEKTETRDKATARFIQATHDDKQLLPVERYRSLVAVARLGGKGATACLREWLKGREADMAIAAADGLAQVRDVSQADALIELLASPDSEIKPAAREALERLTGQKFGFDLVKWNTWLKEQRDQAKSDDDAPIAEIGPRHTAEYDPYVEPIQATPVDLVIVYDTTGSMTHVWPELLKRAFGGALQHLMKNTPSLRIGTIKYRASDPRRTLTYMISPKALTRDVESIYKDMRYTGFGGGSGGLDLGIKYAISAMNWRAGARKVVLVVGDCSPDNDLNVCARMIAEGWEMDAIIVNTLYIQTGHGPEHRPVFRELAEAGVGHAYEYNGTWQHMVDMSVEKPDVIKAEEIPETAQKLCTPRPRTKAEVAAGKPALDSKPKLPPKAKASADDESP